MLVHKAQRNVHKYLGLDRILGKMYNRFPTGQSVSIYNSQSARLRLLLSSRSSCWNLQRNWGRASTLVIDFFKNQGKAVSVKKLSCCCRFKLLSLLLCCRRFILLLLCLVVDINILLSKKEILGIETKRRVLSHFLWHTDNQVFPSRYSQYLACRRNSVA